MYSVTFKPSALKELNDLNNKDVKRIMEKITALEKEPRPVNCKKLKGSNKKTNPDDFFGIGIIVKNSKNVTIKNLRVSGYKVGCRLAPCKQSKYPECTLNPSTLIICLTRFRLRVGSVLENFPMNMSKYVTNM